MSHLKLWEQVSKTDPKYTKAFTRPGGFKGTAINATYLARLATEKFGPIGIGWGVEVVEESYIDGAPIVMDGREVCREVIHKVRVKLWYKFGEDRGEITQYGLTTFVGKDKYGPFTDEEAPKKSLTDGMTKCLTLLGFASDIHLGLYDDNKYVSDLRAEFAAREVPKITEKQAHQLADLIADCGASVDQFLDFFGISELEGLPLEKFEKAQKMLNKKKEKSNGRAKTEAEQPAVA